jgi:hypothetical protein
MMFKQLDNFALMLQLHDMLFYGDVAVITRRNILVYCHYTRRFRRRFYTGFRVGDYH